MSMCARFVRRLSRSRTIAGVIAVLLILVVRSAGELVAQTGVPTPEFYGLYTVSGGKLINADDHNAKDQNRLRAPGMSHVSSVSVGIARLSGVSASADSYGLLFLKGRGVPLVKLGRFEYVERLTAGTPFDPDRVVEAKVWLFKADIPLKIGPVPGKQDLIRYVPARPLPDGVYAWYGGSLETMGAMSQVEFLADFVVGTPSQIPPSVAREVPKASSPQSTAGSAGRLEAFEMLLRNPGTQEIPLSGLPPSPRASGRVAWHPGRGGGAIVSGLPTPPPDKMYQLWALVGGNPPVSAGVLIVDSSGSGDLSVRPLPGVTRVDVFVVTLEPAGGLPSPSGGMYLMGKAPAANLDTLSQGGQPRAESTSQPTSPSSPSPQPPVSTAAGSRSQVAARPKIADLTRGIPNTEYFPEKQRTFSQESGAVWDAAKRVLQRRDLLNASGDRIGTEDRSQGILITELTVHSRLLIGGLRRQYFIVIDPSGTASTQVSVKGFCYNQRGRQWTSITPPDRCSVGFLEDLAKELAKTSQGSATPSRGSAGSASTSGGAETGCLGMHAQAEVEAGKTSRDLKISEGNYRVLSGNPQGKGITATFDRLLGALGTPDKSSWAWWGKYGGWDLMLVDMGAQGPNAFALPGGIVAFDVRFTNLSDDEVAFILGHEISHAILCHAWTGIDFRAGTVNYKRLIDNALGVAIIPAQEKTADEWGFWLMNRAGFDPAKGLTFFERNARRVSGLESWLNRHLFGTHPDAQERLVAARSTVARLKAAANVAPPTENSGGTK